MKPQVVFKRVIPKGDSITLQLGNGPLVPSVSGGWATVARDRRKSITSFQGADPVSMDIPVVFDGWTGADGNGASQESDIHDMYSLMRKRVGDADQPAVFEITGVPVPFRSAQWVIGSIAVGPEIRRHSDGLRVQAQFTITIMEYVAGDIVKKSPAQTAAKNSDASSSSKSKAKVYTVKKGDTLKTIAAKELGKASDWHAIADLNGGIRDPDNIKPGQKLKIPAHA